MTAAAGPGRTGRLERRIGADHRHGALHVRRRRVDDAEPLGAWLARNREHLTPTEPVREEAYWTVEGQRERLAADADECAAARLMPFLVLEEGELVATVTLSTIVRGSFWSANLGYNVDGRRLRRGIATAAVGAACDIAAVELRLHRVQAATLVENLASQGVLRACGFERIGDAPRYLAIAGAWRDHALWQRTFDDREIPGISPAR